MKNKTLIVDYLPFEYNKKLLLESINNNKKLIVSGILQRANAKNQNNRIYPRGILERELQKYSPMIKERRAMGELDHPESPIINLHNVSHLILDAKWNGDDIVGTLEILNTPSGKILKELFLAEVKLGISSRGMGSVKEINEDTLEVDEDFELVGWDFVSNPSTHGAFMSPTQLSEAIIKNPQIVCKNKVDCLIHQILIDLGE